MYLTKIFRELDYFFFLNLKQFHFSEQSSTSSADTSATATITTSLKTTTRTLKQHQVVSSGGTHQSVSHDTSKLPTKPHQSHNQPPQPSVPNANLTDFYYKNQFELVTSTIAHAGGLSTTLQRSNCYFALVLNIILFLRFLL